MLADVLYQRCSLHVKAEKPCGRLDVLGEGRAEEALWKERDPRRADTTRHRRIGGASQADCGEESARWPGVNLRSPCS